MSEGDGIPPSPAYPGYGQWLALREADRQSPAELRAALDALAADGHPLGRVAREILVPDPLERSAETVISELIGLLASPVLRVDFALRLSRAALRRIADGAPVAAPTVERLRRVDAALAAAGERLWGPGMVAEAGGEGRDRFLTMAMAEARFRRLLDLPQDAHERLQHAGELRFRSGLRGGGALLSRREWTVPAGQSELDQLQARLFDAVESGRYEDADAVAEPLAVELRDAPPWISTFAHFYLGILALGREVAASRPLSRARIDALAERMAPPEDRHGGQGYAGVFLQLVEMLDPFATPARAADPINRDMLLVPSLWMALMQVRAALAIGDARQARSALELRRQAGFRTFVDDFLWARVRRIEGDGAGAGRLLASALSEARRLRAAGRLRFESLLCREGPWPDLADALLVDGGARVGPAPAVRTDPCLLGAAPAMAQAREAIAAFADSDLPVLVTGETGTGKELAARALHAASPRSAMPLVILNCAATSDALLESELFGHARGAYTGAESGRGGLVGEAGAGTLVLDEIGDASPRFQSSLLRLLERGEYRPVGTDRVQTARCRFIACTNADLERAVAEGRFRLDLLHRLSCLHLALPALRERVSDIPLLIAHFVAEAKRGEEVVFAPDLLALLRRLPWPGNIRQLRNAVERLLTLHRGACRLGLAQWRAARLPEPGEPEPAAAVERAPASRASRLAEIERLVRERPLARRDLAVRLGLAPRTVSLYIAELIASGRLVSEGSGPGAVYRPPR